MTERVSGSSMEKSIPGGSQVQRSCNISASDISKEKKTSTDRVGVQERTADAGKS